MATFARFGEQLTAIVVFNDEQVTPQLRGSEEPNYYVIAEHKDKTGVRWAPISDNLHPSNPIIRRCEEWSLMPWFKRKGWGYCLAILCLAGLVAWLTMHLREAHPLVVVAWALGSSIVLLAVIVEPWRYSTRRLKSQAAKDRLTPPPQEPPLWLKSLPQVLRRTDGQPQRVEPPLQ